MVNGIVRSPCSFFDATPSGVLINKFSNDLGVLDNSLAICLIDTLEGPASIVISMINNYTDKELCRYVVRRL